MILEPLAFISALIALVVTAAYLGGIPAHALWVSQGLILLSAVCAAMILLSPKAVRSACPPRPSEWRVAAGFYAAFLMLGIVRLAAAVITDGRWGTVNRQATLEALVGHLVFGAAVFAFTVILSCRAYVRLVCIAMALFVLGSGSFSFHLKINGLVGGTHNDASALAFFGANSNQYGGMLTLLTPLFLGIVAYRLTRGGILRGRRLDPDGLEALSLAGTIALLTAVIFWVEARGAFVMHLMLMAGCSALLIFRARFKLVLILLLAALTGGSIILHVLGSAKAAEWFGRSLNDSLSFRISTQWDVLRACLDRPWLGWGEGTLPWILRSFQSNRADLIILLQSYNSHLTRWAESGLLGAALWYAAVIAWSAPSAARALRSPSLWSSCLGGASLIGVLYLGFLCLSDDYAATPATSLILALYLALLMRARHPLPRSSRSRHDLEEREETDAPTGKSSWARVASAWLVIVAAVVTAGASYAQYQWSAQLRRAQLRPLVLSGFAFPVKADEEVLRALRRSAAAAPWSADPQAFMGRYWQSSAWMQKDAARRRSQLEESLEHYRTAIRLAPTWPDTYPYAASVCMALKRREEAAVLFLEGLKYNPNSRDQKLYALSMLLAEAERSRWPEERVFLLEACGRIVDDAAGLERPFTIQDYNYIFDYDHVAGKPRRLPAEDDRRVRAYLTSHVKGKST